MSYNERIEAALAVIAQHNEAISEKDKKIDGETFINCIKASGGTSEERLADLSYEDLLECLPAQPVGPNGQSIKPKILVKDLAKIFRSEQTEKRPVTAKKAEKMTVRELVEAFDPENPNNSVGKHLAELSRNQKFIVYSDGRILDVENTIKILNEIRQGFPGRDAIEISGSVKRVYQIGELPDNYADENPLYRDRPLRPDGTCDQLGRSWEGIPFRVRQFIRVAIDSGELKINHEIAHSIMDLALDHDAFKKLGLRYRKTSLTFEELEKMGKLPILKILLGNKIGNSPLSGGKLVVWENNPKMPNSYRKSSWFFA